MYYVSGIKITYRRGCSSSFKRIHQELSKQMQFENLILKCWKMWHEDFNWMAKALLDNPLVFGLWSERALLALELPVVFKDKVKLDDMMECAYEEVEEAKT